MSSSTVASPPAARPAPPPIRSGKCRWTVFIETSSRTGGKHYSVVPLGAQPGFRGVWRIRTHGTETTYTVAQPSRGPAECTCPDHASTKAQCKHIRALAALGLVKRPKDKPAPRSRAKALSAKTASAYVAAANALPKEVRRHLAAMGPEPGAPAPAIRGTDRRAALAELPPAANLDIHAELGIPAKPARPSLPEGWQLGGDRRPIPAPAPAPVPETKPLPPAPAGPITAGFRQAIADHLALKRGDLIECHACHYPFDPETEGSAARALCGPCFDEEGGAR